MAKQTIALLSGGKSSERDVSLNSGNQVFEALDKEKYEIIRYDPATDIPQLVADAPKIDAALIILHGPYGEDGTVQGLLDLLDIPYQGSGVLGSAGSMNKVAAKQLYELSGIPVPAYTVAGRFKQLDTQKAVATLGLPLVIKPVEGGSSIGMSIVREKGDLKPAVETALEYDENALIEAFVEGTEITCAVIGNDDLEAFPLIEIVPEGNHEFFDYQAKYVAGETREICPARIDDDLAEKAKDLAIRAHRALFCEGYSRTDMILSGTEIRVLETNTIPGMTATSLFPQAASAGGLNFSELLDKLILLGIERHQKKR